MPYTPGSLYGLIQSLKDWESDEIWAYNSQGWMGLTWSERGQIGQVWPSHVLGNAEKVCKFGLVMGGF